jgi:DUF971 family protein
LAAIEISTEKYVRLPSDGCFHGSRDKRNVPFNLKLVHPKYFDAGLTAAMQNSPIPVEIKLAPRRREMHVTFDNGQSFNLSSEYLRVYSPSAEVKGHGGEGVLQVGKEDVQIIDIQPVGNYCIKLVFDDGHDTGLYTWSSLYELGRDKESKWQAYLARLAAAGHAHPGQTK